MPKVTIQFNLPDERDDHYHAMHAAEYHTALWEIANQVFRPARKHGYGDSKINEIIEKLDAHYPDGGEGATELIGLLEEKFYKIIRQYNVEL